MRTLTGACLVALLSATASATTTISFESIEGFTTGPIQGQEGWAEFDASALAGTEVVSLDGRRVLRLADNTSVENGTLVGALSPLLDNPGKTGVFSVDVRIDDLNGASYTVVGQSLAQAALMFRVVFDFSGTIFVVDDTPGGFSFVDTSTFFPLGEFVELRVEWSPESIRYFYGGEQFFEETSDAFARAIDQVVLASDAWQDAGTPLAPGRPVAAYFDDVTLAVPGPSPACAGALGIAFVARRRRVLYAGRHAGPPAGRRFVRDA